LSMRSTTDDGLKTVDYSADATLPRLNNPHPNPSL
jgi:hypothetical protein